MTTLEAVTETDSAVAATDEGITATIARSRETYTDPITSKTFTVTKYVVSLVGAAIRPVQTVKSGTTLKGPVLDRVAITAPLQQSLVEMFTDAKLVNPMILAFCACTASYSPLRICFEAAAKKWPGEVTL